MFVVDFVVIAGEYEFSVVGGHFDSFYFGDEAVFLDSVIDEVFDGDDF